MDLMFDLETLGKRPGCSVLSVGAVAYDPVTGHIERDGFYANIDRTLSRSLGFVEDAETLAWWQDPKRAEAWAMLQTETVSPVTAASRFWSFVDGLKPQNVWCWGLDFDVPIFSELLHRLGYDIPWDHRAVSCARSVCKTVGVRPEHVRGEAETHHHAMHDSIVQARTVVEAYHRLGLARLEAA